MQKKEEKIREYLKRLNMMEIFACLDEKDIAGLSIVNYKKGEYLFHAGDKVEAIFFLAKGKCRISNSTSEGKEIAIDFDIPSGRLIGEMELVSGIDFFHSVSAAVDSDVLRIPLEIAEKKTDAGCCLFKICLPPACMGADRKRKRAGQSKSS